MDLNDLPLDQKKYAHEKIQELVDSDGWKWLEEIIKSERETFIVQMADAKTNPSAENLNYLRGIIAAANNFITLPTKTLQKLGDDINVELRLQQERTPAKAGD